MFCKELVIKDDILDQTTKIKDFYIEKVKRLTLKLKMPRNHLDFLKKHGALDEFVSAKLTGDDVMAKWLLKDVAKSEIIRCESYLRRKKD